MPVEPPLLLLEIVARFDRRADIIDLGEVMQETDNAIKGLTFENDAEWTSVWAEWAPWEFSTHETEDGGPWKTYFQPMMTGRAKRGGLVMRPNLQEATPEVIAYWGRRAEEAKHPVMKARYADLVWDTTKFVTQDKPAIKFAQIAIDSYVDCATLDDGTAKLDTREGLTRALQLALKIQDKPRIAAVVDAMVVYVERTAEDDHISTYCYLFDNLLPSERGPVISAETEQRVISLLEAKFNLMIVPGGPWDVEPHSPEAVGLRLAAYYGRKKRRLERERVLRAIAETFERRAAIIAPMIGIGDLQRAGELYIEAGLRHEAERVRRASQELGPKAAESMGRVETRMEVPIAQVEKFQGILSGLGNPHAIASLAGDFIPDQVELKREADRLAKEFPLQAIFRPQVLAHDHIAADVGDADGDPDGEAVWRTSRHIQLEQVWLGWGLDHIFGAMGFTPDLAVEFIAGCPLFEKNRLPIVRAGLQAHLDKDYLKSVHLLVPQIEKAIINLLFHTGGATIKPHQSGRGVMQQRSLNDVLRHPDDPLANANTIKALGPDLRVYLVAALSHPKGLNIRNEVCHGLWPSDNFTKTASERVIHILFAVALLRPVDPSSGVGASSPIESDPDGSSEA